MIEKPDLTLGIVPLTDCAPIAMAVERGFFRDEGLNVTTSREMAWATIRDKLAYGVLDAAHMIAPMALASTLGVGGVQRHILAPISLGLNGNAITVSNDLYDRMCDADPGAMQAKPVTAQALKRVITQRHARGEAPLTFGMVFPVSTHNYELRYWMASAGIDPDHDVNLIVIPPAQMVAALREGKISGYCVGEPWNSMTVAQGIGRVLITKRELWNNSPEKVLGVSKHWADRYPQTLAALIRGLARAGQWLDDTANHAEAADLLAQPQYVGASADVIMRSLSGGFRYAIDEPADDRADFFVWHRHAAQFPWRSHGLWFLTQMLRWGQLSQPIDLMETAAAVHRPDLYRRAVEPLGLPCPAEDMKDEGIHDASWEAPSRDGFIPLGPDQMFDGRVFRADEPMGYLQSMPVRQMTVTMDELANLNAPA